MLETIARVFWVIVFIIFGSLAALILAILYGIGKLCELTSNLIRFLRRKVTK